MKPVVINGDTWLIQRVSNQHPSLVDRTGNLRIATTDPVTKTINISELVTPPLLDRVLLHEIAHAITISYGLLFPLRAMIPDYLWIVVEEWSVELLEKYAIEAAILTSKSLGRPLCINGYCM